MTEQPPTNPPTTIILTTEEAHLLVYALRMFAQNREKKYRQSVQSIHRAGGAHWADRSPADRRRILDVQTRYMEWGILSRSLSNRVKRLIPGWGSTTQEEHDDRSG